MAKILLVDDESRFRQLLAERLRLRGYDTATATCGEDAIKAVRTDRDIDVVLLDRKMPGMSGEQTLKEIKEFRPELPVVMLTGHGGLQSAREAGRLDAYRYLRKPVELETLIEVLEAARQEKGYAAQRHEVPVVQGKSAWAWLLGTHNSRPLFILLGLALFAAIAALPLPSRMTTLLDTPKAPPGEAVASDTAIQGYADYRKMAPGTTVARHYSEKNDMMRKSVAEDGATTKAPMGPDQAGRRALIMLALIVLAALFWASGAAPVGVTALIVGAVMYLFDILPPDRIAQAFAKDAVIFIFGVTNFMSDGATVAAIGPITVPMATIANVHPWMIGLATAFASSFAHMLIIGTPSNALAFALAKDPVTGEQLVTLGDFMKHGFAVVVISFAVLWGWAFFGYWRWIGFPPVG